MEENNRGCGTNGASMHIDGIVDHFGEQISYQAKVFLDVGRGQYDHVIVCENASGMLEAVKQTPALIEKILFDARSIALLRISESNYGFKDGFKGVEGNPPNRYKIRDANDFLFVPPERLADCLREFEVFLNTIRPLVALAGVDGKRLADLMAFEWIDDGKDLVHVRVVEREEDLS